MSDRELYLKNSVFKLIHQVIPEELERRERILRRYNVTCDEELAWDMQSRVLLHNIKKGDKYTVGYVTKGVGVIKKPFFVWDTLVEKLRRDYKYVACWNGGYITYSDMLKSYWCTPTTDLKKDLKYLQACYNSGLLLEDILSLHAQLLIDHCNEAEGILSKVSPTVLSELSQGDA